MKGVIRRIQKRRKFTEDFKKSVVKEYEKGTYSVKELSKLHGVVCQTVYNWIYKYSSVNERGYRVVELSESSDMKVKDLEARIKELERIVGRKQIQIDFLEKMIDLAKEDLDIDLKKNYSTPRCNGSEVKKGK